MYPPADGRDASPSMSADLALPARLLMGAGPTNPDPRVLRAMATGLVGQFDPAFTALMAETQERLRQVFRTRNRATFPVPGTSRAAMEAAVVSLVEPGERVVVVENGRFGLLFEEIARRAGAEVAMVRAPWGEPVDPADVARSLDAGPAAAVLVVHAETSTGVVNPVREVAAAAHRRGSVAVVDAVCSFAGAPLETDAWELDVVVAGTQKCLGCPSGLGPVTYSDAVAARMARRRSPIRSNYLDLTQIDRYWSPERLNHHTAPTEHGLWAPGSPRDRPRGGSGRSDRAPPGRGRRDGSGAGGAGPRALRPASRPRQDADAGPRPDPRWRRRCGVSLAAPRDARDRDHGRVRAPRRPDLADRHDGGKRPAREPWRGPSRRLRAPWARTHGGRSPTRSRRRTGTSTGSPAPPLPPDPP